MAKYGRSINWTKTVKGFTYALGYAGEHLTNWAKDWMVEATQAAMAQIDSDWPRHSIKRNEGGIASFGGHRYYPWYTGQLHNSVAGVVSDQFKIIAITHMPEEVDAEPQYYQGQIIYGHDWGVRKALEMQRVLHFVPGVRSTVVIGVPYADKVDEMSRHAGYKQELANQFASAVEDFFMIKAQGYRTRFFTTK